MINSLNACLATAFDVQDDMAGDKELRAIGNVIDDIKGKTILAQLSLLMFPENQDAYKE